MAPLMILVAGPYRSGTNDDPTLIARNVAAMTDTALRLFRAGHLPVIGEWFASVHPALPDRLAGQLRATGPPDRAGNIAFRAIAAASATEARPIER